MIFREFVERALFLLSVPKCVCCKEPLDFDDKAFCKTCMRGYLDDKTRDCSRCAKILSRCTCSNFYLAKHGVRRLIKLFRYETYKEMDSASYLVYSLKQDNRRDTFHFTTEELTAAIRANLNLEGREDSFLITNVPRRRTKVIEYGYDHAEVLARRVAANLGIEYFQILTSKSKKAQKETHGIERVKNAQFDYKAGKNVSLKGKTVILIDDIVTTGASLAACAKLIRALGCRNVVGAALGIAYRDAYIKPTPKYNN